jgi:PAS domain S-box-containing protein
VRTVGAAVGHPALYFDDQARLTYRRCEDVEVDDAVERQAALVLEGLAGAVIAVDREDRVTVWNAGAERLFGWTASDVLGRPLPIVPPGEEEGRREWLDRATAAGASVDDREVTTRRLHRDGHLVDVVLQLSPVVDEDGVMVGSAVLCRDATPRLQTVHRLAQHRTQLDLARRLVSVVPRLLGDLDLTGVLQAVVDAAVELLRTDAGVLSLVDEPGRYVASAKVDVPFELAGHTIVPGQGLHGQVLASGAPVALADYSSWEGSVEAFRGGGFRASVAVPVTAADGRITGVLSVHSTAGDRNFDPEEVEVLGLLADFAAVAIVNARTYRRVESERGRFLSLVESVPAGLAVVEDGVVRAWNPAAAELTGWSRQDVLGRPPPLDLDAAATPGGIEVTVHDRTRVLEALASELPDGTGRLYLIQDLTDQRDLERAKDLFFATTSHELKTPLTVVRGLAGTLLRHWDRMPDDRRIDALETIERRADNLDRLIERILVGSRVRAGVVEVVSTPVAVGMLVAEIVEGFALAGGPDHRILADVEPSLPLVAADRQVLDTILGHLLENAIKYSPEGGEIVVRAVAEPGGERVRISVRDHGVGIDGDVGRLLHPFVQADSRPTRRFGGVGLGLYIVRQLVEALQGELTAGNAEGGGAEFAVAIPTWR